MSTHILNRILKGDFPRYRYTVFSDLMISLFLDYYTISTWPQSKFYSVGQFVDSNLNFLKCFLIKSNLFAHNLSVFIDCLIFSTFISTQHDSYSCLILQTMKPGAQFEIGLSFFNVPTYSEYFKNFSTLIFLASI